MTLGQFATVVGAIPRWVQNARAILQLGGHYSAKEACQLGLAKTLAEATGMPLVPAFALAAKALAVWPTSKVWEQENVDGSVRTVVDVERYLSTFATRLSLSRSYYAERGRGRLPKRARDPIEAARRYGVDIGLLEESLKRTPAERLRRLDEDARFLKGLRFVKP